MSGSPVETSRPAVGVMLVTLSRPEKLNALNAAVMDGLAAAFAGAAADTAVRVVVLTGSGRAFSAGADIAAMAEGKGAAAYDAPERRAAWAAVEHFAKPLIAAVDGLCIGGGLELALLADIIVAAPGARFGLGETRLGLLPGDGATQRLPRLIGHQRAARMVLTGDLIDAATAEQWGLIAELSRVGTAADHAIGLATNMATLAPSALARAKRALRSAGELPLRDGLALERELLLEAYAHPEAEQGIAAFLARRGARS